MAFSGNIEDFSLIDVLQLVSQSSKTGILHVTSEQFEADLYIKEGKLIEVKSSENESLGDKLGTYLLNKELITKEQLIALLEKQKKMPIRFGTLLVKENILTKTELRLFMKEITQERFLQILSIESGTYNFTQTIVEYNSDEFAPIDLNNMLLGVLKDLDEIKLFRSKIQSLEVVYSKNQTGDEVVIDDKVTDDEPVVIDKKMIKLNKKSYMVYSRIDGTNNINEIIMKTGYPEHFVLKTIFILYNNGKIDVVSKNIVDSPDIEKGDFSELLVNLILFLFMVIFLYSGYNYYNIFKSRKLLVGYDNIHNINIKKCKETANKIHKIENSKKPLRIYDKKF